MDCGHRHQTQSEKTLDLSQQDMTEEGKMSQRDMVKPFLIPLYMKNGIDANVGCICCDKICFQAKPVYTLVRITIGFVSLPLLFIEDKESSGPGFYPEKSFYLKHIYIRGKLRNNRLYSAGR